MTTYAPPARFAHGQFPTAAALNSIVIALDAIGELESDGTPPQGGETLVKINLGVAWDRENWNAAQSESNFYVFHRDRYLHYRSTGAVEDPTGIESPTSLANENEFNVYDLEQVSWLTYGMMYKVVGVTFCAESDIP